MDWASRAVLSWRLSNTLDGSFCVAALEEALGSTSLTVCDDGYQAVNHGMICSNAGHSVSGWPSTCLDYLMTKR
jgi:hypothetical protein